MVYALSGAMAVFNVSKGQALDETLAWTVTLSTRGAFDPLQVEVPAVMTPSLYAYKVSIYIASLPAEEDLDGGVVYLPGKRHYQAEVYADGALVYTDWLAVGPLYS